MSGKQDWRTPPEFLEAVRRRFGPIGFDLAATKGHEVTGHAGLAFSPEMDSLSRDWSDPVLGGKIRVAWLNPPFANIRPWAAKCDSVRDLPRWTLMLVPASMGSHWWADHVLGKCFALGVPRMKFLGAEDPYPKDLALCCYGYGVSGTGFWDWRRS